MPSEKRRKDKYPEREKNRAGRYSTVNDNTARGSRPIRKHIKKRNPVSIIVTVVLIIVLSSGGIYTFLNWDKLMESAKDSVMQLSGTPTPLPTVIATPTPTVSPSPTPDATPSPTPIISPTLPPEIVNIKISAIGDIMCHQAQLDDAYNQVTGEYDFSTCFADIAPSLQNSDLVIGSVLTTFSGEEQGYSGAPLFNTPVSLLTALADAGVDVLTTGNSHIFDYGWIGVERTNKFIKEAGMMTTGTYLSEQEYYEPFIINIEGVNIAVLSYTDTTNGNEQKISDTRLDYCIKYLKLSKIKDDIQISKEKGADIVIVCLHWGEEYTRQASEDMRNKAQYILEQGADIILGTKLHMIQQVTRKSVTSEKGETRERVVAYSLGNFISNQRAPYKDAGMILNIYFQKNNTTGDVTLTGVDYVPTWVSMEETEDDSAKNFKILPVGKYLNTPELLNSLPQSAKERLQEVWNETTTIVGMNLISPLNE